MSPSPVVVVMGVSGAGKTTVGRALSDRLGWSFVEGDDLHPAANVEKMRRGVPLDDEDRRPWLAAVHREIVAHRAEGTPVVVTCSALRAAYRRQLAGDVPGVVFVHLAVPDTALAGRLAARRHRFMPASLLQSQLRALEVPTEALVVDADRPVGAVVDDVLARLGWDTASAGSVRSMSAPRIAIGPAASDFAVEAVEEGGGRVVALGDRPDALVWLDAGDVEGLASALAAEPGLRWVQLPFAGVERVAAAGLLDPARQWTCAKGSYAEPVAEHALMLALAGLRAIPTRVRARSWGAPRGTSLYDRDVTILGGGGIARALLSLLAPLRVRSTVVRRSPEPVDGAVRTVGLKDLAAVLPGATVVFLALALTPETTGVIDAAALAAMDSEAWLVNVARGAHVDTDALVAALRDGAIGGAALDVTDPEPLPDGHPLWELPNCIVTPHLCP